jgi:hypothetical protein
MELVEVLVEWDQRNNPPPLDFGDGQESAVVDWIEEVGVVVEEQDAYGNCKY